MKLFGTRLTALLLAGGVVALMPGRIQAQTYNPLEKVAITATAYSQVNSTDNGTTTTSKAPVKSAITTTTILRQLCQDEFFEEGGSGPLTSGSVPAKAVLAFNGTGFEIDYGTNQLDVSDMFTWTITGANDIIGAGSFLDVNGAGVPPYSSSQSYIVTLQYNPNSSGDGNLQFTVSGLATVAIKAGAPNGKTGKYTASGTMSFTDGTGEGSTPKAPFVLTGFTITASGSEIFNNGAGSD